MPKLRKPNRADIFGLFTKYVELEYLTKGQAKRKLRNAGCGAMLVTRHDIEPQADNFAEVWAAHTTCRAVAGLSISPRSKTGAAIVRPLE